MSTLLRPLTIFVSSPSDVADEQALLRSVVDELNGTVCPAFDLIRIRSWEDVPPSVGMPQAVINEAIGEYDVFIGFMWKRYGTPTGLADSGTEEEASIAYTKAALIGRPRIMFYFSEIPYVMSSVEDADELRRVLVFREKLQKTTLFRRYTSLEQLAQLLRHDLCYVIRESRAPNDVFRTSQTELLVGHLPSRTASSEKAEFMRQMISVWAKVTHNEDVAGKALTQLLLREELGDTLSMNDVAIPHIYHLQTKRNYFFLLFSDTGVNWASWADSPARIIIFMLLNQKREPTGIRLLSRLSRMSRNLELLDSPFAQEFIAKVAGEVEAAIRAGLDLAVLQYISSDELAAELHNI